MLEYKLKAFVPEDYKGFKGDDSLPASIDEVPMKQRIVEQHGDVINFTVEDLEAGIAFGEKQLKEVVGKREFEQAKITNVESHHPFVLELSDEDRLAVFIYHQAKAMVKACEAKIAELNTAIATDSEALANAKAQVPEIAIVDAEPVVDAPIDLTVAEDAKEYDGPMGNYKVIGEIESCDEDGEPNGIKLEIGSVQNVPTELGDSWVNKGLAEVVSNEEKTTE